MTLLFHIRVEYKKIVEICESKANREAFDYLKERDKLIRAASALNIQAKTGTNAGITLPTSVNSSGNVTAARPHIASA